MNMTTDQHAEPRVLETLPTLPPNGLGIRDPSRYRCILGVRFFAGTAREAVEIGQRGGLVVVPSAPVLVAMTEDCATRDALLHADFAITDSGLMVLLWNTLEKDSVHRVSGLVYLKLLLNSLRSAAPADVLWVMPSEAAAVRNVDWLRARGHSLTRESCYVAPAFGRGRIEDPALLEVVRQRRPSQIIMAIGGGVQEKLGYYLRRNLDYIPAIHCTGAAIGFLSGDQVNIPPWADRLILGWFFRCLSEPSKFLPRYRKAMQLLPLLVRYRDRLPVARPAH